MMEMISLIQIIIFGWLLNTRLSYDMTVNQAISIVNNRLRKFRYIVHIMTKKQRLMALNAFMLFKIPYGMPLIIGKTEAVKYDFHWSVMILAPS